MSFKIKQSGKLNKLETPMTICIVRTTLQSCFPIFSLKGTHLPIVTWDKE